MTLNKVSLIGRLTRDPESKVLASGMNLAKLGLATNHYWKDSSTGEKKEKPEFHNVVAWRKLGEICKQYLHKGDRIFIEGRLQTRRWDDKKGNKKQQTEIIANDMIMLGGPSSKEVKKVTQVNEEKPAEEEVDLENVDM